MFAPTAWDADLNDAQLEAVTHGDDPLVVVAGAGTGKTAVLTSRVARLLEQGVKAERILLLTFTRRAADQMLARAARMAGLRGDRRPRGGTFHAVAYAYVSSYAEVLDLPKDVGVLDPAGACDLLDLMREEHGLTGTAKRLPASPTLVEIYSRCINNQVPVRDLVPAEYPWCEPHVDGMAELFRGFTARKRAHGLLDFDDLLLGWRALLAERGIGAAIAGVYDHVLVDEYQDLNGLQVDIVKWLAPDGKGLTIVGDEAQAIYGFRGSNPNAVRTLVAAFPSARTIRLEVNYRSRQPILDLANLIRPRGATANEEADAVELTAHRGAGVRPRLHRCHDAGSEARAVVDAILEAHESGGRLRDHAILVRAAHHSDLVELELSARRVPYHKYGGLKFLEAAHVKDFVAAGRLLGNQRDEVAWYRVLRLHPQIGPARARSLIGVLGLPAGAQALLSWPDLVAAAPPKARGTLSRTLGGLAEATAATSARQQAQLVLDAIAPLVVEKYGDGGARCEDLERLVGATAEMTDLMSWLAELTLDPPLSVGDRAGPPHLDEDYVTVSTIHSAKGLEWPVVHVPHVLDGCIPSDMSLKSKEGLLEEHRLFYVAVTRARDDLRLYAPLRMPHHRHALDDRHSYSKLSRFLDGTALETIDQVEERVERRVDAPVAASARVSLDLDPLWN